MSQLVVRNKSVVDLDGFADFTSESEGDSDINTTPRVIQGTKLKFIDPDWSIEGRVVTGMSLTVLGVRKVVNKWSQDGNPLVVEVLAPGKKFPDFDKLNAECPRSEWREAFGKETGPWSGQHCLYLVDPNFNRYTWASPTTTIGSSIAVREIVEQIQLVRKVKRDENLFPVAELGHTHFPNRYRPDRERPYLLNIKQWVKLGSDRTGDLPAPDTPMLSDADSVNVGTQGAPADAQTVAPPTAKEIIQDEIKF